VGGSRFPRNELSTKLYCSQPCGTHKFGFQYRSHLASHALPWHAASHATPSPHLDARVSTCCLLHSVAVRTCTATRPSRRAAQGQSVSSVGGEAADGDAAEGAAGGGLDPWHGAGPVEAVAAGEVRQHVARPELLQAHRALSLLLLLRRLVPPAPAEPPAASFLREHLPLQRARCRRRVLRMVAVVAGVSGTARRDRQPEASRAVTPANRSGEGLVKPLSFFQVVGKLS
jgi:hypothetical protein